MPASDHAVAELTIAFLIMLARRVRPALEDLARDGRMGDSVIEGAAHSGLGAARAAAPGDRLRPRRRARRGACAGSGPDVHAFDPHVAGAAMTGDGVKPADLATLLAVSDFVSLHARATTDNAGIIGEAQLAAMRPSAYLVNTRSPSVSGSTRRSPAPASPTRLAHSRLGVVVRRAAAREHHLRDPGGGRDT